MDSIEQKEEFKNIMELFLHLQQFFVKAGSSKNTFEMLLCLPDMDQNFHRLPIVKEIKSFFRNFLTTDLENFLDTFLNKSEIESNLKNINVLENLSEKMVSNKTFCDIKLDFEDLLRKTLIKMGGIDEIFENSLRVGSGYYNTVVKSSPITSVDISLNSSLNQSGFLFLNPSQYISIAESLDKKSMHENTLNSLDLLLIVTPGEPVSQALWPTIRKSLKEFLQIEDDELFSRSLRFHSRLLSSQIFNAVKEGFLNLVDALCEFWLSKKLFKRINKYNYIPLDDKILSLVYLLLRFLKEFPFLWIRYPSHYVNEISCAFFNLFSIENNQTEGYMSFIDILSLLDPKADWFHAWTHSQIGRKTTFHILKTNSSLLSSSLSISSKYLSLQKDLEEAQNIGDFTIQYIETLKFNHSLNILFCIIRFADGRSLYPIYDKIKKDHVTLKKCLHYFAYATKIYKKSLASKILLELFYRFCNSDENTCKLFCELGIVDSIMEILDVEQLIYYPLSIKSWYLALVLKFFISVNSTPVGHEYILIGKTLKSTSKVLLTTNIQTPAQKIFDFMKVLITVKNFHSVDVMKTCFGLCCAIIQSPLGRHFFLSHSFIKSIILYAKNEFNIMDDYSSKDRITCEKEFRMKFEEQAEIVIRNLLHSHNGLIILEKNNILIPILDLALQHFTSDGIISVALFTKIVCVEQGCIALGKTKMMINFWNWLKLEITEEPLIRQPLQIEDIIDSHEKALIPLICICTTYEGLKLLYSSSGLLEEFKKYLLSPDEQESELYSLILKLLGSSASNLDGILYLEIVLSLKDTLLQHQTEMTVEGKNFIDENSLLRNHILSYTHSPKKILDQTDFPPLIDLNENLNMFCGSALTVTNEANKLRKTSSPKKQSELGRFLNDTRRGIHDGTWLNQCRRAYKNGLLNHEEAKAPQLMEMLELSLDALASFSDEVVPGTSSILDQVLDDIPSPISTSFSNNIFCYSSMSKASSPEVEKMVPPGSPFKQGMPLGGAHGYFPPSLGIEIMIRYGSDYNLIPNNEAQRSNLLKLRIAVDSFLLARNFRRFDWFSVLLYFLTSGNVEKTFSLLRKLRTLKIGAIIWPYFMGSLWMSHYLTPNEFLFSSLIHSIQLVLFRDNSTAFLALESISGGIIWNIVSEWFNHSFIGVLSWPENLHIIITSLLYGGDYLVYALVSILLHLHQNLVEFSDQSEFKKIIFIQTKGVNDWKIHEHFTYMDSLCKRFRRIVNEILYTPLTKVKINRS